MLLLKHQVHGRMVRLPGWEVKSFLPQMANVCHGGSTCMVQLLQTWTSTWNKLESRNLWFGTLMAHRYFFVLVSSVLVLLRKVCLLVKMLSKSRVSTIFETDCKLFSTIYYPLPQFEACAMDFNSCHLATSRYEKTITKSMSSWHSKKI